MRRILVICCLAFLTLGNLALTGCQQEAADPNAPAGLDANSKPSDTQREQMRKSRMPPAGVKP